MNIKLYELTKQGVIRMILRRGDDGNYLLGISDGTHNPLYLNGSQETIENKLDQALANFTADTQKQDIADKLNEAEEAQVESSPASVQTPRKTTVPTSASAHTTSRTERSDEQMELDLAFNF